MRSLRTKEWIILALYASHWALHTIGGIAHWFSFTNPFLLILLGVNGFMVVWFFLNKCDWLQSCGFIALIAGHGLIGHQLSPTYVTSAAMLMGNMLIFYVGLKLYVHCSRLHLFLYVLSYFCLYGIFVLWLKNAEPLFLLALLGLAGTARDLKLLSFFWALVLSFTVAQPYAWQTALLLFFLLKILYSVKMQIPARATILFLGVGLVLLFCVLFPVAIMMMGESAYNLFTVFKDEAVLSAIGTTLLTATCATLILSVMAIPLSYALARTQFTGKSILLALIDIPIIIPQSVAGIALLKMFGKQQIIGGMLYHAFGLRFDGTVLGIILAQLFVALPFMVKSSVAAFESVPEKYEIAARTLGANSFQAFRRIALPLAGRGVFLGAVIAWARAAGEFGAVFFIAASPETAPIAVYTRFMSQGLAETAPLVSALLLFSLIMFFLLHLSARLVPSLNATGEKS